MSDTLLRTYLKDIEKTHATGNATEHSYRSHIKNLLETLSPGTLAMNEPKRVACGAPDFILTRGQTPLGSIETKDIGVSLDHVERTDQMKRYLASLGNLILTDYIEFRWYVAGQHRITARLAKTSKGKWLPETDGIEQVSKLLQAFMLTQTPTVSNPRELATRMASMAQLIRNAISLAFKSEYGAGSLHEQMEGFQQVLLPDLNADQFADMYAQTICYGLFAARCNARPNITFTREHAVYDIPKTNPFLRKMFGYIAGPDLDESIVWAVDDLAEVLNRSDMGAILRDFGKRTRQQDPVVHFYETFLAAYDPKMREARGVYYTPEPVVSYIVRSVDYLLKKDFALPDGLADATKLKASTADGTYSLETHKVQILDPATGTATFLHSIIDHIHETFKGNKGMWSSYVSEHLLPRLFGFELLMAPYAVAHMKLGLQLAETGYDFKSNERLRVYLTNTLEEGFEGGKLPFAEWLVDEATAAGNIKHDAPVMVVIGNPPYSYESKNIGAWISRLVRDYYQVDDQPLGERNPKGLQDDYVKFIRFAQWRIKQTGYGILAFITNHGYLDNPTFRGMRQSLMQTFDDIYVLDLHGNSKKKQRNPEISMDENVFDIQQGVSIGIFVKNLQVEKHKTNVYHSELWGAREYFEKFNDQQILKGGKYYWLAEHDLSTTNWTKINSQAPFYLFIPQNNYLQEEYDRFWKLSDTLLVNSVGIATSRDDLTIHYSSKQILDTVRRFSSLSPETAREVFNLGNDTRDWQISLAQNDVKQKPLSDSYVKMILYRPFDFRYTYYTGKTRGFISMPRYELIKHMLEPNLAVYVGRQGQAVGSNGWDLIFCGKLMEDYNLYRRGNNACFPLYLYPQPNKNTLFDTNLPSDAPGGRRPNLSPAFIKDISHKLNIQCIPDGKGNLQQTFGPEDIFHYMYAIFHSLTYRSRYAEFLKIDFPRLPLTSNTDLFRALCQLGERLVALHLMEQFGTPLPTYPVDGNHMVEKVEYLVSDKQPEQGRVYINKTQYFEDVPQHVWEFHIGGYQVCHKWLKDRKGRVLSFDDIRHYQRIVAALAETITLMAHIDEAIEEHGGWPISTSIS